MAPWPLWSTVLLPLSALPVAADVAELIGGLHTVWDLVVVQGQNRGHETLEAPSVRNLCQFGLTNATLDVARYLLGVANPQVESLELHDVHRSQGGSPEAFRAAHVLATEFGERVKVPLPPPTTNDGLPGSSPQQTFGDDDRLCDVTLFTSAAPRFSLDRVMNRLPEYPIIGWLSGHCLEEQADGSEASPDCSFLNTMWEKSILMRRGFCSREICLARVPKHLIRDPNVIDLDCKNFREDVNFASPVSEFGQDWFPLWNFLKDDERIRNGGGVYVDVGASIPFEYSNTVFFDRCLKWRGVCAEPNPYLLSMLRAYRGCQVFPNCVDAVPARKTFVDNDAKPEFVADCLPLQEILDRAGLGGQRIDVLSIDVEHGEMRVLNGLPLEEYDIRIIIVEVTRGALWLQVDSAILPYGYAKVAILGRDAVYVKLSELRGRASWPFMTNNVATLPSSWSEFHQRVIDEEVDQELKDEKEALEKGQRRW